MIHAEIVTSQGRVTEKQNKKEVANEGKGGDDRPRKGQVVLHRQDDRKQEEMRGTGGGRRAINVPPSVPLHSLQTSACLI